MYGYTDDVHHVWICYVCGSYSGQSNSDMLFFDLINSDPLVIFQLVHDKILKPIE